MRRRSILTVAVLALLIGASSLVAQRGPETLVAVPFAPGAEALTQLDRELYDYHVFEVDLDAITRSVHEHGALELHLGNQQLSVQLEANDLRAPGMETVLFDERGNRQVVPFGFAGTYQGTVIGDAASSVRLSVLGDLFMGYVKTTEEWLFVDPLRQFADGAAMNQVVVYRDIDVREDKSKTCGADHSHTIGGSLTDSYHGGVDVLTRAANTLQVATEHDGQLFNRYGNPGIFNFSQGILNGVEGIYVSEINTDITITFQQGWSSVSGDPYTSLNAQTTLFQFRDWWNANVSNGRDAAHQFSGKNFSGGTIGIAWVGVICNVPNLSYGVSEDQRNSFLNVQLTAHEIGHNLSARHDNESPVCPGVSCTGFGPIMCSFIQSSGTNQFSGCSKSSINSHISNFGSCL